MSFHVFCQRFNRAGQFTTTVIGGGLAPEAG
jgi:hypothetical protein